MTSEKDTGCRSACRFVMGAAAPGNQLRPRVGKTGPLMASEVLEDSGPVRSDGAQK